MTVALFRAHPVRGRVTCCLPLLVGFGLSACGGIDGIGPEEPEIDITVSPSSLELEVGETSTLAATVTGAGDLAVSWTSSDVNVAVVEDGLVTAVGGGSAEITVSVDADPAVDATAIVTVTEAVVGATFAGLTKDGEPLDPDEVSGSFTAEVDLSLPSGFDGTLEFLLDDEVVSSIEIQAGSPVEAVGGRPEVPGVPGLTTSAGSSHRSIGHAVSVIDTRTLELSGTASIEDLAASLPVQPRFPDGEYQFTGRIRGSGGDVVQSLDGVGVTLRNRTALLIVDGQVIGPSATNPTNGRTYGRGDLEMTVAPVSFDGSTFLGIDPLAISRIEVLQGPSATAIYGSQAVGGVINVILKHDEEPEDGGLLDIGEGRFGITGARLQTSAGEFEADVLNYGSTFEARYPNLHPGTFDLDFRAPSFIPENFRFRFPDHLGTEGPPTFYMGAEFPLDEVTSGLHWKGDGPAQVFDEGSGIDGDASFEFAQPPYTSWFGQGLSIGSEVGFETGAPDLRFRARFQDRLGQSAFIESDQLVQTDFTPPTFGFLDEVEGQPGIPEFSINVPPGLKFYFDADDPSPVVMGSGLASAPFVLGGVRSAPGLDPEERCVAGTFLPDQNDCIALRLEAEFLDPSSLLFGEYVYGGGSVDAALNFSGFTFRYFVQDEMAPVGEPLTGPDEITVGGEATFTSRFTDDLEFRRSRFIGRFENFGLDLALGSILHSERFDGEFNTEQEIAYDTPGFSGFTVGLTDGTFGRVPSTASHAASEVAVIGSDTGRNRTEVSLAVGGLVQGSFQPVGVGVDKMDWLENGIEVCWNPYGANGDCGDVPEEVQTTVDVYFVDGAPIPFDALRFGKISTRFDSPTVMLRESAEHEYTDFGSFQLSRFYDVVRGSEFPWPGTHAFSYFAFDNDAGVAAGGDEIELRVVRATRNPF